MTDFSAETDSSLVHMLQRRAESEPDRSTITFLNDGGRSDVVLTLGDLDQRARSVAAAIQHLGVKPGARALLLYAPGVDYITAFYGCLYAGVIAVPAYPPDPSRLDRTLPRLQSIAADAEVSMILTRQEILLGAKALLSSLPEFSAASWIATDQVDTKDASEWKDLGVQPSDIAFLQYTSGSTGAPKGVMLQHAAVLHNLGLFSEGLSVSEDTVGMLWLPPYHDLGLIGGILQVVYARARLVLMSPLDFLKKPLRWLEAMTKYGGTVSGAPNFAYDLCVRKVKAADKEQLDLSAWEVAGVSAEPIRAHTIDAFSEAFASCGFHRSSFYPSYGLAEATLIVTGRPPNEGPKVQYVDAKSLEAGEANVQAAGEREGVALVSSGMACPGVDVRIVDPEQRVVVAERSIGEIWVRTESVAKGYWGRPEESAEIFGAHFASGEGPFLRTGDLGYLEAGHLYVTGRSKDLIIIHGRNLHPQDIELVAEQSSDALRPGCGVAFSISIEGEERLVIVHELDRGREGDADTARAGVTDGVSAAFSVTTHEVVLIARGALPKTSSGKLQRSQTRIDYLAGALKRV